MYFSVQIFVLKRRFQDKPDAPEIPLEDLKEHVMVGDADFGVIEEGAVQLISTLSQKFNGMAKI